MVIRGYHTEVLLAAGYAVFLMGVAMILEFVARHAHHRSEQYERVGFTYRREMDLWECPAGKQLTRIETDHERRIVRYRAAGEICNACPLKNNCTDSQEGRMLEHRLDSWVESELRRFHRGISLALMLLGTLISLGELARHREPKELLLLTVLALFISITGLRFLSGLTENMH